VTRGEHHDRTRLRLAAFSLLATAAVVAIPQLHAVYPSPTARAAVQMTNLLCGALLSYLFFGRFLRTGRLDDLLLANSLSVGVCGNLVLLVVLVGDLQSQGLSAWVPAAAQLLAGVATALAAFAPSRVVWWDRRTAVRRSALVAACITASMLVMIVKLPGIAWLPRPGTTGALSLQLFSGPTGVLVIQAVLTATSACAAIGFGRKADRDGDEFAHLLGLSFTLSAFARVNYLLMPSLYTQWVSMGDLFRMSSSVLMLWAAAREIRTYWDGVSVAATLEERRRMARDLHDGLAQELAYITRRVRRGGADARVLADIGAAADRALVESRRAIAALSLPLDERFEVVLARTAEDIASRAGARVSVRVDPAVQIEREHADALIRIVCEAVRNATSHGHADHIDVELAAGAERRLTVRDNGVGFAANGSAARAGGFGIVSMRERAAGIGGQLEVDSEPGAGTTVEVLLP
jgi:signal transduction histidine kinase